MGEVFSRRNWHPVASEAELPPRHVHHAMLMGHEFVVWRADDDTVNVWENRCLHRGVRLSIGVNTGTHLRCQYHGWRYANGTAACAYIPAHPANAPSRTIRNRTYPVQRRYGLVWSGIEPEGELPELPVEAATPLVMRPIPVNAHAEAVLAALLALEGAVSRGHLAVVTEGAVYLVQPVAANRSVIRGVMRREVAEGDRLTVLRRYNDLLSKLRGSVEATAIAVPEVETVIPLSLPVMTQASAPPLGRQPSLRVRVAKKWREAADVCAFRLEPLSGVLPAFEPGAHIDVHLPNGLVRQYSLTNGPGETPAYVIGVKREAQSGGGSKALHDDVGEGDVLAISAPHNNFKLHREGKRSLLIAGGIGVTPLLAMARALSQARRDFAVHYFVRSADHAAFRRELEGLGGGFNLHTGLDGDGTRVALEKLLETRGDDDHVYVCGPGPMLEATRAIAEAFGWPESAIHFEYFSNERKAGDASAFEVALARSALTLQIPADCSIVDVLRANGVAVATSCEQGACGTCMTTVLDGVPDHRDVYLSRAEQASNACIMPCISRAKSPRLVLDL